MPKERDFRIEQKEGGYVLMASEPKPKKKDSDTIYPEFDRHERIVESAEDVKKHLADWLAGDAPPFKDKPKEPATE